MCMMRLWLFFGLLIGGIAPITMSAKTVKDAPVEWYPAEEAVGNLPTYEADAYKRGILIPLWATDAKDPFPEVEKDEHLYSVAVPTIEFFSNASPYAPDERLPVIVVAPGGGYGCLAYQKEGVEIARQLRSMKCHTAVLKYSIACEHARERAHFDALRALEILQIHADQLGIDTDAMGMMGFSAGAHLTATVLAHPKHPLDFAILMYPAYLSEDGVNLNADVVPQQPYVKTFVMQCRDDRAYVQSSLGYASFLTKANAPVTYHLYSEGGHGFGGRLNPGKEAAMWHSELRQWFQMYLDARAAQ
ncbi:MAG: alpha/beta hydrolase [bacterium]|nr:alpha/beta hydrolase [bacterium]